MLVVIYICVSGHVYLC